MKKVSASDAKNRFGSLLDEAAMEGCVQIVKHGRVVGVLLSPKAYEALQKASKAPPDPRWNANHIISAGKASAAKVIRPPGAFDE